MSQTRLANQLKETKITSFENEVIQGCLLGDGTLSKAGKNYRLRIEHSSKHQMYVVWKFEHLKRLCISDIQYISKHDSFRFGTVGHPEMTLLRQVWYSPMKEVPKDMVITPLIMAIWFMDDGTKHRDTVDFSVHNFSRKSLDLLQHQFSLLDMQTTVNSDAKGNRLYILKKSYPRFKRLVKPYIVSCMAYKLP